MKLISNLFKPILMVFLLACLFSVLSLRAESTTSQEHEEQIANWRDWPVVGQATLSWLFWDVYHSKLRTEDGVYVDIQGQEVARHPLVLEIHYLRTISREQLLDATGKQWQKLGYSAEQIELWLAQLTELFPSVDKGQRLVYFSDGQQGQLWYSPSLGEQQKQGLVLDPQLNEAFLAIWLSPRSDYPKLRNQLIGKRR